MDTTILEKTNGSRPIVLSDIYGRTRYLIGIGDIGTRYYLVYGDCLQDAIDFIVDLDGDNIPGFFADDETTRAYWNENDPNHDYATDYYTPAGNVSELFTSEIHVIHEDNRRWR